ncbi:MAG TPA: hypothetical protein VMH30_02905 [Verrucomicrobiae bacterium]|nr:hypothetical protein [Verrucomicrobiae bacterium]
MKTMTLLILATGLAIQASAAPPAPAPTTPITTTPTLATSTLPTGTNQPPAQAQPAPVLLGFPMTTPSASTVTPKRNLYWFTPAPSEKQNRIQWYGNVSSRPWTDVVGWHPGQSQFPTGETAEPQLTLLQVPF